MAAIGIGATFSTMASVLKVDESVVKRRRDVDPVTREVAPVVVQIGSHKSATHQDCQAQYNCGADKMLHFG